MSEVEKVNDEVTTKEADTADVHPLDKDKEFLVQNSIKFGKELEGMDKQTFKTRLDYARFLDLLYYIKVMFPDAMGDAIEEATYDKITNLFNNQNIYTSWNETQKRWQCILFLKGGILHIHDNNAALAALRAYIFVRSAKWYQNDNLVNNLIGLWQKTNNTKEDPYYYTEADAEKAAEALGTSVEEIEEKIKSMAEKSNEENGTTVH